MACQAARRILAGHMPAPKFLVLRVNAGALPERGRINDEDGGAAGRIPASSGHFRDLGALLVAPSCALVQADAGGGAARRLARDSAVTLHIRPTEASPPSLHPKRVTNAFRKEALRDPSPGGTVVPSTTSRMTVTVGRGRTPGPAKGAPRPDQGHTPRSRGLYPRAVREGSRPGPKRSSSRGQPSRTIAVLDAA